MADQPPEYKTKDLPKASPEMVAIANLSNEVKSGFRLLAADMELMKDGLDVTKREVAAIQKWKGLQEDRMSRNSMRASQQTEQDMEQAAQLAQEKAAREELASKFEELATDQKLQLAILSRLDKVASNPVMKVTIAIVAGIVTSWLANRGLK